jgi:hypothetical protein
MFTPLGTEVDWINLFVFVYFPPLKNIICLYQKIASERERKREGERKKDNKKFNLRGFILLPVILRAFLF